MKILLLFCIIILIYYFLTKRSKDDLINIKLKPSNNKLSDCNKEKEAVLPTRITNKKHAVIKGKWSDLDNMNCRKYVFSAKFSQTKRIRTKQQVMIFDGDDFNDVIKKMGFEEPITITSTDWSKPTIAQINYLRDKGLLNQPTGLCSIDVSCILSTYETGIGIAPYDLYQYATNHRIVTSFYAPEDYLYENIWSSISGKDRVAFFYFVYIEIRYTILVQTLIALQKKI